MKKFTLPISDEDINSLKIGDIIAVSGDIFTGRDIVLPKIVELINKSELSGLGVDLTGSLVFHTAVSPAGIGPTSSNKLQIEGNIEPLSEAGVKIHLGKGALSQYTIEVLKKNNSIFAVTPPVTALLNSKVIQTEVVAYPEDGMEAFHKLTVKDLVMIVAIAKGESIYGRK